MLHNHHKFYFMIRTYSTLTNGNMQQDYSAVSVARCSYRCCAAEP